MVNVSLAGQTIGTRRVVGARAFAFAFAALLASLAAPAARAQQAGCDSARPCDEAQIGDFVAPDAVAPKPADPWEARGKPAPLPLFGLEQKIRVKPGSGLWVAGEPITGGNVFLNGSRSRVSLDLKVGF
jgi:hypothetical protein